MTILVREITAAEAYPLRRSVLRTGTISTEVAFDRDDEGFHLAGFDGDDIVGVSSWLPLDSTTYQLRGMATDPTRRGEGIGSLLLSAGLAMANELGAQRIVANARVAALGLYLRHGFESVGDVYLDDNTTGLPHQRIRLELD